MLSAKGARQLFAVHRWTGLLSGVVILFLSITGSALVFITEIDRALNRDYLVSKGSGEVTSPDRAVASIQQVYPKARVNSLYYPKGDDGVYLAYTNRLTENGKRFDIVTVDAHSADVLGTRDQKSSLAFILRQMHLRFFFFGWKGRVVVGAFGVVLLVSTITGLFIYGRFIRALPHWWSVRKDRGLQISTSDWHKLIGIVALVFNLVIAVTGAVLGLENLARFSQPVREAIHPAAPKSVIPEPPTDLEKVVPVSVAVAAAQSSIEGFIPVSVSMPNKKNHYTVHGNLAGHIAMEGASEVGVDATNGRVFFVSSARSARPVTKAYYWMDPLHFGYWGGIITQIIYAVFGLTTGFLSITGFIVWYMKKTARKRRPVGIPAAA